MKTSLVASVAIASKNPVKIAAAKEAFFALFPGRKFEFVSLEVPSGVPNQPFDEETIRGAVNRAKRARRKTDADFGIGIEGGIRTTKKFGHYAEAWTAVCDREGRISLSQGAVRIPVSVMRQVKKGLELGYATDAVFGTLNIKHGKGLTGIATGGFLKREQALAHAASVALAVYRADAEGKLSPRRNASGRKAPG